MVLPPNPGDDLQHLVSSLLAEAVQAGHLIEVITTLVANGPVENSVMMGHLREALALITITRSNLLRAADRLGG